MLPSAYWYYGLMIISLILIVVSLIYKKDLRLLALHLQISAVIYPFEIIVLILLNGYYYLPGILQDARLDNYLGSYVSNFFIIPASAVVINAFSMSWNYVIGIAAIFMGIDWYFTELGIYRHFWWKSLYTGIGLCILYEISKWIWRGLHTKEPSLWFRVFTIYMTYASLHNIIVFSLNRGGELFRFQINWFLDPEKGHQFFSFLHLMFTSIIITICLGLRLRFRYRLISIVILTMLNCFLEQHYIFIPLMENISAIYFILVSMIVVLLIIVLFTLAKLKYLFP